VRSESSDTDSVSEATCEEAFPNIGHVELATRNIDVSELIEGHWDRSVICVLAYLIAVSLTIVHSNKRIEFVEVCLKLPAVLVPLSL
jgi:hypothetical protein